LVGEKKEAGQKLRAKELNLFNKNVRWRAWLYNNDFDNSNARWRDDSKYDSTMLGQETTRDDYVTVTRTVCLIESGMSRLCW